MLTVLVANRGEIACRVFRTLRRLGHSLGRRLLGRRRALAPRRRGGRRRPRRARAGGGELPRHGRDPRRGDANGRPGHSSGLRLFERERRVRGGGREPRHRLHRADARADAHVRAEAHRAVDSRKRRRAASSREPGCSRTSSAPVEAAERIGYPVMLKSTAGGGGIGMRLCRDDGELAERFDSVSAARRRTTSSTRACSSKASSSARATSRCRSSATARAASSRSASATAPRSGATRR